MWKRKWKSPDTQPREPTERESSNQYDPEGRIDIPYLVPISGHCELTMRAFEGF